MASGNQRDSAFDRENGPKQKPPCSFCNGLQHGIWTCRQFEQRSVEERWNFARYAKHLCLIEVCQTFVFSLPKQGSSG